MKLIRWVCLVVLLAAGAGALGQAPRPLLRLVRTIPLPGVKGRLDHLALDPIGRRLFLAAEDNNTVEVIDLAAGRRLRSIPGLRAPQGVAYLPPSERLFVTNQRDGSCMIFDARSFRLLKTIKFPANADNIRYDPASRLLYVGYGRGGISTGGLGVIDTATDKLLYTIPVAGHPEGFALETRGNRLFVNIPAAAYVTVINRSLRAISASWPLGTATQNYPLAFDETHQRLFVGCRRPAIMLVYESVAGGLIASPPIDGDVDDIAYDPRNRRVYVTCGQGSVDVFEQGLHDQYRLLGRLATAPGTHSALFAADSGTLYLAVPATGGRPAEIRVYQTGP